MERRCPSRGWRDGSRLGGPPDECLAAWRDRRRALVARASAPPARDAAVAVRGQRAAGSRLGMLVRAVLATVDLGRPEDVPGLVATLGAQYGGPPKLVVTASRLAQQTLGGPVLGRARQAAWLARDVPVTAEMDGILVDERLDLVFEEASGLVAVLFRTMEEIHVEAAARLPELDPATLSRIFGCPIHERLVVPLEG